MAKDLYSTTVVSTRIRLARNFDNMPFPNLLKRNHPMLEKNIGEVFNLANKKYGEAIFHQIDRLSDVDKQALLERHLISPNLMRNDLTGALVLVKDKHLSIMLNEEDHIRAQCLLDGFKLNEAYEILNDFDIELGKVAPIAFDSKLGYLTSCPTNLGQGMRASVMLFLPALTISEQLGGIIKTIETAGLTVRGVYGEGSESMGCMYQISNQRSLGISAEEILERVSIVVKNVCEREEIMRKSLYKSMGVDLEDRIMRSLGKLLYARKISSDEFMNDISMVKFGIALEICDYDIQSINKLIDKAQPANLCCYTGKMLGAQERDIARAQLIRDTLTK